MSGEAANGINDGMNGTSMDSYRINGIGSMMGLMGLMGLTIGSVGSMGLIGSMESRDQWLSMGSMS